MKLFWKFMIFLLRQKQSKLEAGGENGSSWLLTRVATTGNNTE